MDLTEESLQDVKEALASLFLTTLDFGKYLLVMRSECDLIIREEPYIAYMLWLNVESGQIISRTWSMKNNEEMIISVMRMKTMSRMM